MVTTTARFSKEARRYAEGLLGQTVVLVDGPALAGLMIGAWFGAKMTHLAPLPLLRVFIVGMPAVGGLVMILFH